jgi:uncharacterized membrane protein YccC
LIELALAVAPLALLAALNPHFRIGPFTAVIVVLGGVATHSDPIQSAFYRVMEVALGGITGLVVSFVVFPARARVLTVEAAADMLNLIADSLPALFAGCTQPLDEAQVRQIQDRIGATLARVNAVGAEAKREQMALIAAQPDPGPLMRTLLRLRHDLVMIGRATVVPLPDLIQPHLREPLALIVDAAADYLRACGAALMARSSAPSRDAFEAAMGAYMAAIETVRRERLTQNLPSEEVERIFTLAFLVEQLHRNFIDLARCISEYAQTD